MFRISSRSGLALWIAVACAVPALSIVAQTKPGASARADRRRDSRDSRSGDYMLQVRKDFPLRGGRVSIENSFGDVNVTVNSGNTVELRAIIRASSADRGREIRVVPTESASGIDFRTDYPKERHAHFGVGGDDSSSYSVDYDVSIPSRAGLKVENHFGNIVVTGARAAVDLDGAQGAISVRNCTGRLQIDNSFGPIETRGSGGELTLRNANGPIRVQDFRGSVDVANRFGPVVVRNIERNATVRTENGPIEVSDVDGWANVSTSFGQASVARVKGALDIANSGGKIDVSQVGGRTKIRGSLGSIHATTLGSLEIVTQNSNIEVTSIAGDFSAEASMGTIRATGVRGNTHVSNSNGNVSLTDTGGDVSVKTTFGSVFVQGAGGAVTVDNQNGAVSVAGLARNRCHDIVLKTNFSSIKLALPADLGYAVDARTSFGSINSAIPVSTTSASSDTLRGVIGKGGCRLDLSTANGNITIERE